MHNRFSRRGYCAIAVACILAGSSLVLLRYVPFFDTAQLTSMVGGFGALGPFVVMILMALAIVVSPIPSGPIALAAGALYGPMNGTLIVITGALAGALVAFGLARHVGRPAIAESSNRFLVYLLQPHSPRILMAIIFASRLVPFISFDAVSYAAGLTSIGFVRFALATTLGIVPVSFGLAYLGNSMQLLSGSVLAAVLALACLVTLVPFAIGWMWQRAHRR